MNGETFAVRRTLLWSKAEETYTGWSCKWIIRRSRRQSTDRSGLFPPDRVSAGNDRVDQVSNRLMQYFLTVGARIVTVRRSSVAKDAHDFGLGQDTAVVQRQKQRLAYRESGSSCHIRNIFHMQTFHRGE